MGYNTQKKIDEITKYRGLPPIKKGQRLWGGNSSANLNVLFDDEKHPMNCHPYWRMKIFNPDNSIAYQSNE